MATERIPHLSRRGFLAASGVAVAGTLVAQQQASASHAGGGPAGCPVEVDAVVPLPATAFGPSIPSKGYLVEEIADGLHWVTEGGATRRCSRSPGAASW